MLTHRKRIENCLSGQTPDRPPAALWRHFPVDDQTAGGLANASLVFQRTFDWDMVKVTPSSSYCLVDWGVQDIWKGHTEGTREYTRRMVQHPEDWEKLPVLDPHKGHLAEILECLRLLVRELGEDTPIIQTIFNPLAQAKNLAGGQTLLVHARQYPDALQTGLQTITETTRHFIEAAAWTGIDGIFYAVQHAQYSLFSEAEYAQFGRNYDLQVLEPAEHLWLRLLHLHGLDVMFNLFTDYPVNILNWHDRETPPALGEALRHFPGLVCGGVSQNTLVYGTPEQVRGEALEALQDTSGERILLGTGCVTPVIAPYGNMLALRQSVE
jgi:uroporphyrinogen decarboxylase